VVFRAAAAFLDVIDLALARVPDVPQRVDTRGMLLSGRAEVDFPAAPESMADGFVVSVPDAALVSVVAKPPRALIREVVDRLEGDVNVLCEPADVDHAAGALPNWHRTFAILHVLGDVPAWTEESDDDTRVFTAADAPPLTHVPLPLRRELTLALRGRTTSRFVPGVLPDRDVPPPPEPLPMAASWAGRVPVSFCYPVFRTEAWWDVSVETLEEHRRHGHASRAARAMIRHMWRTGRAPVWGARIGNDASFSLAHRLGFREVGRLAVLTAA
jgi:RimJ/RimL family protein N-acetyltransferase